MIAEVKKLAKEKGYAIFSEPFKLNIWGFRANSQTPNTFDDEIHVFLNIGTLKAPKWFYIVFAATTDPGTFWLKNPSSPQGTAILNPGQYVNVYAIDLHRGKYKALCQRLGNVSVTRDYNRDAILDFNNGKVVTGQYGINIHRASRVGSTFKVDEYSAGCQVCKNADDFEFFMKLCEIHRSIHGNKFTYTLVDKRMEFRQNLRAISLGAILIGFALGGAYLIKHEGDGN